MKEFPKKQLGFFPTPLHKLVNLSGHFDSYQLFIKRDDQSGLASGGNKVRKLEYLLGDAIAKNCNTIITAGAQQSNHCRQTAAACAMTGLECHLLLGGTEPGKYEGNLLLSKLLGAEIYFTGEQRKGEGLGALKKSIEADGKETYLIPYGGSNITGALGFVEAVKELQDQLKAMKQEIDYVFFASSSGGMQTGLSLGKVLYDLSAEFMPVCIDKEKTEGMSLEETISGLVNEGRRILEIDKEILHSSIIHGYDDPGYGVVTENERSAMKLMAGMEGIILDPVYTARAFSALLDYLEQSMIPAGSNILFWHTGGFPAVFQNE